MNGYPEGSLEHNVPFIVASGLNATANELPLPEQLRDNAILIKSELPPLESKEADVLEAYFEEVDKKSYSWKGVAKDEPYRFRIRTIGRVWGELVDTGAKRRADLYSPYAFPREKPRSPRRTRSQTRLLFFTLPFLR